MNELILIKPDDWHCHLRDQAYLERTVPDQAKRFARTIVMPNLVPPVTEIAQAQSYLLRIQPWIPANSDFQPLLTLYLTEHMQPKDIVAAKNSQLITAYKLYPAHATTHSQFGIQNIPKIYPLLEAMQKVDMPLLIHGEVNDAEIDIFDREAVFIDRYFHQLVKDFPQLRMVFEHVSTKTGVQFVKEAPNTLAATITPHHLLLNRNQLLAQALRPHHYCAPIIKSADDQAALLAAATSGNPKFFLGTDSAPHSREKKESACCAAGIYNAAAGIELYAEVFDRANALPRLENFTSRFGATFYRLPVNTQTITLVKKPWTVPATLPFGPEIVIPLMAGETLSWQLNA